MNDYQIRVVERALDELDLSPDEERLCMMLEGRSTDFELRDSQAQVIDRIASRLSLEEPEDEVRELDFEVS